MSANHDAAPSGVGFAGILRRRRRAANLTQEDLAGRAGLGVRTVRELERGRVARPQRGTVMLLADALELAGEARDEFITAASSRRLALSRSLPLPTEPDLIGRELDIAGLTEKLSAADLVSVIGLAGVGKTSLALAVAHRFAAAGREAVAVSVSAVAGVDDVLAAVAAVFGVHRAEELNRREALLVLDGVDRSPDAAREAITWLRRRAPAVKLLATSLSSVGGLDWRVEPLDLPPEDDLELAALGEYPAVALFLSRLGQVRREPIRDDEVPALAELVRRLCGLPLAIELAAARGRILEIPELLERYGSRVLDLGVGEPSPWQIRDAVAATYRLLAPDEQHVLRRLSSFQSRWSLELAEALLGDRPGTDVEAVLDRLVALGLVSVRGPGDMRFRMLDVVADYAAEEAGNTGERTAARTQHARVIARTVGRLATDLAGPSLLSAVNRLDLLNADIRAALRFTVQRDPHTALRIAAAIPRWCRFRGRDRAGLRLLRQLLDDPRTAGADPILRAWGEVGAGLLAFAHGSGVAQLASVEAALATFQEHQDIGGELAARSLLSVVWRAIGRLPRARRHAQAVLSVALRTEHARDAVTAEINLAWHDTYVGDLAGAERRLDTAIARTDDARLRVVAQAARAEVARLDGRHEQASDLARRALPELSELGDPRHRVRLLSTLGRALAESGRDASPVLDELAAPGPRSMVLGYLALRAGEREVARAAFIEAGHELAGRDEARDVLECLVGAAACAGDPDERRLARDEIDALCRRTRLRLLPRDRALLA